MRFAFLLFGCVFLSQPSFAQTFFYKEKNEDQLTEVARTELDFKVNSNSIEFPHPEKLAVFTDSKEELPTKPILQRAPTDAEKAIDLGLSLMTGLLILQMHQTYDLTDSLRLSSHFGLIFFIFPYENHFLYRSCKGQEYLIATSLAPNEENWNRMKSLDEVQKLCEPEPSDEQAEHDPS